METCSFPCLNGGECVHPDSCNCSQYQATGDRCQTVPNVGYERDMICRTWGQYNYETFDGLYYYFPGKCTYTLVRECGEETEPSFVIQVHNDPECHSSAYSCSRSVSLFFPVEAELRLNRYNVTYNGQSIQLPHVAHDVEVERISQYTLVTLQHGFTLAWDGSTSSVYIKMSPEYIGRTCGLCGNFNADVRDDLKTSYDLFTHDTAIFGNSWMEMVPHEHSCPSVPADYACPCLTQNYETRQKVQEMCILLLETPFKECHDLVSPFPFMASCSNDLCIAGPDNQVLCQALTEYARACAHAEHPLHDWRAVIPMCAVECDDEFTYRECITCCPVSCNIGKMCIDSKLQCLDGCYCPEDLIYDNGSCVKASQCPCEYHGMLYSPGQEVQDECNSCTCMGGSWNCTEYSCPGECSVTGDIHFETFDGRVYTFQATCQYILAKSRSTGKFTISLQNAPCGANLDGACIQSVNIIVDEDPMKQITVTNMGEVYVSNLYRITPPYSDAVFQVHELSSMFLQVKTEDGLNLQYNWKELRLYLQVDESWKEDTIGLCGTFNGNIQDDFLSPAGMIESTPQLFGNSWKLSSACVPGHNIPQLDPCDIHQQAASYASEMCEILNKELFAPCHEYLSPAPFYQQCKSDTCKCGETCLCGALAHYARQCRKHRVIINFRAHISECAAQCQETMEYGTCISSCNRNCRSLSLSEACGEECVEGCVCPGGTYYNSKSQKCVQKNECSCNFLGVEYTPGDIIMMSSGAQICKDGQMMYQGPSLDTKCPPGQFYFKCSDSLNSSTVSKGVTCERTCESHLLNLTCSGQGHCVSGCICPPGLLKHGDECFEPVACPCLWKGKEYYPGDKVTSPCHNCVCQHGSFQCIFHPCPSMCTAYGDRHYRTFDGLLFDYIGACKVYLVKSNIDLTMSVAAENVDCYESGVICRKSLLINIGRSFIMFDDDSGKPNPSSLIDKRQPVFIWQAGYYTIAHIPTEDVTVLWDRKTTIHIQVGPRWQGKLTGLCGNFDLKTVSEMRTPENIESATPQEFGNSWTAAECVNSPDIRNPCSMNPLREPFAKRECGILLGEVFQACHPVVDVTWFYMNCLTDTCGCNRGGDCECFCTSVSAYAHRCCQQGIAVDWRSPTVCPYDCEFYNKVLGKGPFKLVTCLESETVLAANFSGGAAFPVQGAVSIPGVAMLFMLTPGLSRSKPHDATLVSLEAAERPNYFLHLGPSGYLRMSKWEESERFQEESTFIIHKDTWLAGYDSFESYMKPGFFVHYMLSSIHLMKYNHSGGFRQATLFKLEGHVSEFPSHSTCQWRYDACVSACYRSCSDPAGEACNTIPKVEGCMPQCPHNMVLDEVTQKCVYLEDCIKPAVAVEPSTPQSAVSTPGAVTSPSVNATVSLGSTLPTTAPTAAAGTTTETQRPSPTPTSSPQASSVTTISPKPLGTTIQTTPGNDTTESLFTTVTTREPNVTKPEGAVTFSPTASSLTLVTESITTTAKTSATSASIPISTSERQTTPTSPYTTGTTTESTKTSSAAGAFLQTTTTKPSETSKVTTISVVSETELLPTVDWTSSAIESPSKATTVLTSTSPRPLKETEKTTASTAEVTGLPAYTSTSTGTTKQPRTSRDTETSSATVAPTTVYIDTSTKVVDKTVSPLTTKPLTSESTVYSSPFKTVKTSAYITPDTKSLTTETITSTSTVYFPSVETGKTTLRTVETTPQLSTDLTTSKSPGYSPPVETGKTTLTETTPQLTTSKILGYSPLIETGKTTLTETTPQLPTELTTSKSPGYSLPIETGKTTLRTVETTPQLTTSKSLGYSPPIETGKTTLSTVETTPQLITSKSPGYSPLIETGKTTPTETTRQLPTELTTSKSPGYSPQVDTGKTTLKETTPQLTTSKSPGYSPLIETGKTTPTETTHQLPTELTTSKSPGYSPLVETGKTTLTTVETKPQLTTSKSPGYSPPIETGKTTLTETTSQLTTSKSPGYSPPIKTGKTTLRTVETTPKLTTSKSPSYSPLIETGKTTPTETTRQLPTELTTSKSPGYSPLVETGKTTLTETTSQLTTSKSPGYSPLIETGKTTPTETTHQLPTELTTSKSPDYSPLVETGKTTLTTVETKPELTTSKSPGYSPPVETGKTTLTETTSQVTTSKSPGYSPLIETGKTTPTETTHQLPTELTTSKSPDYSPLVETGKTTLTTVETKPELTTSKSPGYSPPVETGKTTLTETTSQLTTSKSPGYSPPIKTGKTTLRTVETTPQLTTSKSPSYSPLIETGKTTPTETTRQLPTELTTSKSPAYISPFETLKTTAQEFKTPLTTKPVTSESTIYVSPFEMEETTALTTQLTISESSAASTVSAGPTVSLGTTAYPSAYTQTTIGLMTEKTTSSFPTKLTTTTKTTAYPIERVKTTPASAVPLASTEKGRITPEVPPTTIASTETSSSAHQVGLETTKTTTSASSKETTTETVASMSAELTKTTLTTLHTVDKVDTNITTLGTTTVYPFLTELSKTTSEPTKSETTVPLTLYSMASEKVWTTITPITTSAVSKSITSSTTQTYPSSTEHTAETTTTGYMFSTTLVMHPSTTPPLSSEELVSTVATVPSLPQLTTSKTTSLYQTLPGGTSLTTGYRKEKTSTAEQSAKPVTQFSDTTAETVQSSSTTNLTSSTTLIESSTTSLQTVTSQSKPTTTATTRSVFSTIKSTAETTPGRESKHTPFSSGTTKTEAPVLQSTTAQLLGSTLSTSKVTTSSETQPVQTTETSTLSALTTSQLKTEVTNATAATGKEGASTLPPKKEVSTTLLSTSHAPTPVVTLRTTGTSQVTPETAGTVTTTPPTPKPTLATTSHTTTLFTSSTETPKEKWTTIGKIPTEEVTVSRTIVPLSTATTLLIYSPVTPSAITTAATTASIRTEKQTTQAVTPSKPVMTESVTAVLNVTVPATTGKETTTSITTAAQTSTASSYKTTQPETSTGQTTKQPASTLESTAATTQVTPNATTAAESLRTTSSEYWLTTSKEAVSNMTVSVLSTVSPTSSPPATTAETQSSSVSGSSVFTSTSTSYTNATEYWSTQTTAPLLSSNETLTPLSPQSTTDHTTTTLVTSTKMCTPQYSEIIDECTKYVCMNGQLMLFNKSQNCPYNATPPNCGLLGFAILVNGDKCCPQWDCPCRCSVFPDLNIITFDGNSVAIYKAASYIVTQLPNETVSIQVQECQSSDTLLWNFTNLCLVALNITHKAHQVLIDRLQRRLYVNSRYARPRFRKNGFEILDTGNMYLIKTPAGLKIQWFHSTGMMVIETDSPSHKLTTMGLCGCCDGDPANDLTLFNGTTVSESEDPTVFIDSWQVPNTTGFMGQNRRREVNCSTSDCSECLSMLSNQTFSSCHAFVPPKMFCEVWVRDAEYVKSPCTALAAYVAACHKFSICIEWRSPDYCSFTCPPELRYQACLPACNAKTCPNHEFDSDPEECSGLTEGCVCPEGTLLHRPYSALCIPSEKCACTDSFGTPHASGEVWKASKDGCCMYKCDNDSIIPVEHNCTKVPEPICSKAGEVTVSLADDKSCCPQKACVCNQTLCDQYAPECKYGEKLVSYYRDYSCCPDYICECDPDRCESDIPTCRDDQTLIATRTEGSCCMAYICMCESCSDSIPTCQEGEVFTVDANSTDRCCPPYHCVCETYRCREHTCPLGMSVVTVWSPDLCCPLNTCECACDTIPKPQCKLGEMPQIDNEFLTDPENQCGCFKYKCVKEQVCVDGERGVMWPGQTLVEHTAEGICYTTQCTSYTDPITSFYKIQVSSTNCTAQCEPNQVYKPPDDLTTCCGVCRNTSCIYQMDNRSIALYKPGTTWMSNCKTYECTDTMSGPTLISYSISCPPFNETECLKIGGTVVSYMDGCCKTCKEDGKTCQKVTVRMTIRKNDCRSNRPVNIVSCDGKCPSASIYNYNINTYARFCKCCREIGLQRRSVQLYCSGNSTWVYYPIQEPTDCSCQWS
ncbi:otogelin-like [Polyodon spathula]|uniref:otogelin-like n=1 Tax=Polyodon spathula TaxID=7913 RepID=UPI001B7F2FA7|nr:otogelin-like [Polyodon spathula]